MDRGPTYLPGKPGACGALVQRRLKRGPPIHRSLQAVPWTRPHDRGCFFLLGRHTKSRVEYVACACTASAHLFLFSFSLFILIFSFSFFPKSYDFFVISKFETIFKFSPF